MYNDIFFIEYYSTSNQIGISRQISYSTSLFRVSLIPPLKKKNQNQNTFPRALVLLNIMSLIDWHDDTTLNNIPAEHIDMSILTVLGTNIR